jgi:hypothetical protein
LFFLDRISTNERKFRPNNSESLVVDGGRMI